MTGEGHDVSESLLETINPENQPFLYMWVLGEQGQFLSDSHQIVFDRELNDEHQPKGVQVRVFNPNEDVDKTRPLYNFTVENDELVQYTFRDTQARGNVIHLPPEGKKEDTYLRKLQAKEVAQFVQKNYQQSKSRK